MDFESGYQLISTNIDEQLKFATETGCSDLFIKVGEPAFFSRYGIKYRVQRPTTAIDWGNFAQKAISSERNALYVREKMLDFSYEILGKYRYRASAGYSCGSNICTFRMITSSLPTFRTLNIDKNVATLLSKAFSEKNGVSILVGATGSGKTSTLAASINTFSTDVRRNTLLPLENANLITLEDPIEYVYPSRAATRIAQKELGRDFSTFDLGIKQALREHPTHILVGETRDKTTIKSLVEAAITGHSVITTFHASNVAQTITRLNSHLAAENQDVMYDLVSSINFILVQELLPGRKGYKMRYQYIFFTPDVRKFLIDAIYKGKNIPNVVSSLLHNDSLIKTNLASDWKIADAGRA